MKPLLSISLFTFIFCLPLCAQEAQVDFVWGKQFGSERDERTRNLAIDALNNAYVCGKTSGRVGRDNFGKYDGFIVKIDSAANTVWSIQVGSKEDDDLVHAVLDESGNLYATGYIGVNADKRSMPGADMLVVKIKSSGEIAWQKQYGTDSLDSGGSIAVTASGDVYVLGSTQGSMGRTSFGKTDCVLLRLDSSGNQTGILQFGTSADDQGCGITIGADSNIYVCGTTEGSLAAQNAGKSDAYWGCYSRDLKQLKLKQFGADKFDCAVEIQTDRENNVYVAGSTDWNLNPALIIQGDCFVTKWDARGEVRWTRQFGTEKWDGINGLAVMQDEKVVVSGCMNNPQCESFCRMYDENGSLLWSRRFIAQGGRGTCGKGVCTSRQGFIFHTGYTGANLFSDLKGGHDVFLIKLRADPVSKP